jgi:hypothetical protein
VNPFLEIKKSGEDSSYKVEFFLPIKIRQKYLLSEQKNLSADLNGKQKKQESVKPA